MALRENILNTNSALRAYERVTTDSELVRIQFALCLATQIAHTNKGLRKYLEEMEGGECKEVLGLDFRKMTSKDYWKIGANLRADMEEMKGKKIAEYGLDYTICGQRVETTADILAMVEARIAEMISLLKEVKRKMLTAPKKMFSSFFRDMTETMDGECVTTEYEEWKMSLGHLTQERLKEKQTLVVADFLKKRVLRYAAAPTQRELNKVQLDKVREYLPSNYEFTDDFKEQCAIFRRFIHWEGDLMMIDYDSYAKYFYKYFHKLSVEDQFALFALDHTLAMIHRDMKSTQRPTPSPSQKGGEQSLLPESLATEEAMALWRKVQKAGWIDENYQPKISRTQAAMLADAMAERLKIKDKWKVFETLWQRKYMRSDYNLAFTRKSTLDFQDELKRLFG